MKKEIWQKIVHIAITILTAIATTFGVSSCMGH
ncbi:MAG: smalltalk protein [Bacteroidaceae bacterium]|nr:smalltalk protein [Bacteroidaceae bacterium]